MRAKEKGMMERFMIGIYARMDRAIAGELDRLQREDRIVPNCRLGCCYCCRYKILTNIAEAHTLAQYLRREWSREQIRDLQVRTRQWHDWDHAMRNGRLSPESDGSSEFSAYDPVCPLQLGGACGAYAVRPVVCRTHFVSSPARLCRAASRPGYPDKTPAVLLSVVGAVSLYAEAIRNHIESAGMEYSRTQMLLPHWLALEMGWDFIPS